MHISDIHECFYEPGKPGIIDAVHPATGLGVYSGETLGELRVRHPGAELGDFDAVIGEQDAYWRRPPVETTAERFVEMLGVLPPDGWQHGADWEVFKLAERTSGNVTAIFCRIGERYFELQDSIFMSAELVVEKCRAAA